jgi:hypothetical protein
MRMLTKTILGLFAIMLIVPMAFAGDWFDMEKCAMCKVLTTHEGLMENMTWEHHNLKNGIVTISTVKDSHMEAFRKANAEMNAVGEKIMKGEQLPMCGMCNALGGLMMKGIDMEYVETTHGDIWLMTSDKPEIVKEIHSWADRTKKEMALMMKEDHTGHDHSGHGH